MAELSRELSDQVSDTVRCDSLAETCSKGVLPGMTQFLTMLLCRQPLACRSDGGHDTREAQLGEAIPRVLAQTDIPGVFVGIWQGNDFAYVRAFGVKNVRTQEPMTTDLRMRIGSNTKAFVVTGVLQMVDQGGLSLDDPISKFIPEVPNGDNIAIRHLAQMRSGLLSYSDGEVLPLWYESTSRQFSTKELLNTSFTQPDPILFEPGARYDYSNTNTVILGVVLQQVSGQSVRDYIHDHIVAPVGLTHTEYPTKHGGGLMPRRSAHGYGLINGVRTDLTFANFSWGNAAGCMTSTVEDMGIWARDMARGTLLKPETQAERLTFLDALPEHDGYGLGIEKNNRPSMTTLDSTNSAQPPGPPPMVANAAAEGPGLRERLELLGDSYELNGWSDGRYDYVAKLGVSAADVPTLVAMARQWFEDPRWQQARTDIAVFAPMHAWRILGQLRAETAVDDLLDMLASKVAEEDDWTVEELPCVFGLIGPGTLDRVAAFARDASHSVYVRAAAARGLGEVARRFPDTRPQAIAMLTALLAASHDGDAALFNGFVVGRLLDLRATEAADAIEQAFADGRVDLSVVGDWDDVCEELGVEGRGLVPRKKAGERSRGRAARRRARRPVASVMRSRCAGT